jgi:subtilisin family serine protease
MKTQNRHGLRSTGVPPVFPWARCPYYCLVFFAAVLPLSAQSGPPFPGMPDDTAQLAGDSGASAWERKLVHADAILGQFEKGDQRVKVIVNLVEPATSLEEPAPAPVVRAEAVRRYRDRVSRRHAEVEVIQSPVLAALPEKEFGLRHRYDNWAALAGEVTLDGLAKLAADPLVESIEFDYPMKRLTKQGIPLIHASEVRTTYNGQGVAIAIVDDGIDYRHPKLGGGGFPNSKVIGGYDIADHDSDPGPDLTLAASTHGTNCAGIAAGDLAAVGDYIGGVACGAKLYSVKVFSRHTGSVYDSDLIAAWDWCINHKSDDPAHPILVISVSLGQDAATVTSTDYTASARKAADVVRAGITLVAAAGNSGWCDTLDWPACLRDVISVGAVYDAAFGTISWEVDGGSCAPKSGSSRRGWYADDVTAADKVAVYSNVAPVLDLFAPGNETATTDLVGPAGVPGDYDPGFGGTSASAPYAAGAAACLQSAAYAYAGRYLSPSQVRDILARTGDPVTDTKAPITKPRINLSRAVEEVLSGHGFNIVPVYRFWSPVYSRHFYTTDEAERNKLLDNYSRTWTYERVVYHVLSDAGEPGAAAVYRFWSAALNAHFYTINVAERDKLRTSYSGAWTYEGPVFYAFPAGSQAADTLPVHRFWSATLRCHFYTISEGEKNKLISLYSGTWTYEGIAWYAYK